MGWELRKKRLLGQPPLPKLIKNPKVPRLHKLPKVPRIARPPKPTNAPPGHEYYWRDE